MDINDSFVVKKKIELLHIKYKSYLIKNVCQKYDKFM